MKHCFLTLTRCLAKRLIQSPGDGGRGCYRRVYTMTKMTTTLVDDDDETRWPCTLVDVFLVMSDRAPRKVAKAAEAGD